MLIIGDKSGQLANRLFVFSHFIANAIEYKYTLINPKFSEYATFFEATSTNNFEGFPISVRFASNSKLNGYWTFIYRYLFENKFRKKDSFFHKNLTIIDSHDHANLAFDLRQEEFKKLVKKRIIIARGWNFRDFESFSKHASLIRSFFKPIDIHCQQIKQQITKCRQKGDVLIGVHIRRGDYKHFLDGKYYFETQVYADKMAQIERELSETGKSVVFLICSNEPVETEFFSNFTICLSTNHFIEDLYSLAQCDYVIGVPSTFTMWASFYGQVPLYTIYEREATVQIGDFKLYL